MALNNDRFSDARISLELISSIKDINARIDELRIHIKLNGYKAIPKPIKRIKLLIETRMKLIYSFMDKNPSYTKSNIFNLFSNFGVTYKLFANNLVRK